MFATHKQKVENLFEKQTSISLSLNIWTNRTMRRYIAITAHMIAVDNSFDNAESKSFLLNFQQFSEPHSGNRSACMIEESLAKLATKNKAQYIITDNAADMRAAFLKQFQINEKQEIEDG